MPLTCSYTVVSQLLFELQTLQKKSVCREGCWRNTERKVLLKHHLTLATFQRTLPDTHSHTPPFLFPWFFLSSPLYPRVISLMMFNALKVFHQPDLMKWSIGNALGHFSSHPHSLSLSLHLCCSLSLHFPLPSFPRSIYCPPEPRSFPSAYLSCLTQLSPCTISVFFSIPVPLSSSVAFELGL